MKTKILHRRTLAYFTMKPGEVDRLMLEAEKITMPEALYDMAADIAATVQANTPDNDREQPATMAAYILRYAYILSKAGELAEAPPKQPRKKKDPELKPEPPKDMSLKDIAKLAIKHGSFI